jgi:hypothetical protein
MSANTYHEEIPDQDVIDQLERMEPKAMPQTTLEKDFEAATKEPA